MDSLRNFLLPGLFLSSALLTAQQPVVADVNLNTVRAVENVSEFKRDVYVNLHSSATGNDWQVSELEEVTNELKVGFGRSVGGVTWQMGRIRESPSKPGFFDLDHMKQLGEQSRQFHSTRTAIHPYVSDDWVMTSHVSPLFPNGTNTAMGWAPANYQSVGQFYAYLVKEYFGDNGEPRPPYVEVINEPVVHANQLGTNTTEIARFHKVVADSIRWHNPGVRVGGYTAAWPEFERNDFAVWDNSWRTFIDEAGEEMDFFSFHVYDTPNPGDEAQRKGSNMEAIFDMIEQYSWLRTGKVKPMMVSEYGACCADWDGPYYPERDWLQLKAIPSMTLSMMERPHRMLKAIPFITDKSTWYSNNTGFPYPHVLFRDADEDNAWAFTHLRKYYELWQSVAGRRVDTWTDEADLQIDAYVDGNRAYVLMTNLEHEDIDVQLRLFDDAAVPLREVNVKHLYAIDDVPQLDEFTEDGHPWSLRIGAEGSMVLEYTFAGELTTNHELAESKYYADVYLQPISANVVRTFNLSGVDKADHGEAILRVGMGRSHGKSLQPTVTLNGTAVTVPSDWRGYDQLPRQDFFGVIEIPVPYGLLQSDNRVEVSFGDGGGHLSTVTLQVKNFDRPVTRSVLTSTVEPVGELAGLRLFPNPVDDRLRVSGWPDGADYLLELVDVNGRIALSPSMGNNPNSLDVSHLPAGLYLARFRTETGIYTRKVVKK